MKQNNGHTARKDGHAELMNPLSAVLGMNVERLRKQANISKSRFALMVGIGRPHLDRIEKGIANPRLSLLHKLAGALDTTPQALITFPEGLPTAETPEPSDGHALL